MILGLFFTRGISLQSWIDKGMLDREIFIYLKYLDERKINKLYLFTYGSDDVDVFSKLDFSENYTDKIVIIPSPKILTNKFGGILYSIILPIIRRKSIKKCSFLKSNQLDGAWSVVLSSMIYKIPHLIRSGYSKTFFVEKNRGKNIIYFGYYYLEKIVYKLASLTSVSSERERKQLIINHNIPISRIKILPNYIDTSLFKNINTERVLDRLLFVGRFDKQKNLENLIKGVSICKNKLQIDFVGNCNVNREKELQDFANYFGVKINFLGLIRNKDLPKLYNSYTFFVLPSLFEGMPKVLIEAMSCGCICIGTDAPGIVDILEHDFNGVLSVSCSAESISEAILFALDCDTNKISINASNFIKKKYSVNTIMTNELSLFKNSL